MKSKTLNVILWYTLATSSIVPLIDIISIFQLFPTASIPEILLLVTFILIELSIFTLIFNHLRGNPCKYSIKIILFYWIVQIAFFGIKGTTYCFITGPNIAVFFKYLGQIETTVLFRFWSQEFTINLNTVSDRIYFGINLIPAIITGTMMYCINRKVNSTDSIVD
jgi:hypothetical protein